MNNNFSACLADVLVFEGGYVNNIHDPGGATNKGIIQSVYDAWRRKNGLGQKTVKLIGDDEVTSIYKAQYWEAIHGDDLLKGIDLAVFDYAVNSGVTRAIMAYQSALGLKADGHFGLITASKIPNGVESVINAVCKTRISFLERLRTWKFFGKGWKARVLSVQQKALVMAK